MSTSGEAVARDPSGRVVFISGALPGERVRAAVVSVRDSYLRARVTDVLDASPYRTDAPCPEVAKGCGSCQWQHITLAGQRTFKRGVVEESLRRQAGLETPPMQPMVELDATGYRTTIRAAVSRGRAGYHQTRRHTVVAVESCGVAHPLIEDLLLRGRYGRADEVVLRCGARTGERLAAPDPVVPITVPSDVRRDRLHEVAAGRTWQISARSFFQTRPDGADALAALVERAASDLGTGVAIDLYSGVGLFAGVLAGSGWSVTSVESSKDAVADARTNLRGDGVKVVRADATRWSAVPADLVVANPSRRGLGSKGVATVAGTRATRVVLVSCDVGAMGRDANLLQRAGYSLSSVTPIDMFPHTFHLEVVSVFDH
jgi:tRNA/tmRNA/rRNA uracil-C5-methylase (TrmA/RlmC/RlmD family)